MLRLEGKQVTVRSIRPEELEVVWAGSNRLDRRAQPNGPPPRARLEQRLKHSGRLVRGRLDLGIEADGRLIGEIHAYRGRTSNLPLGVFQLGVVIYDPADRGKGHGAEAVMLLTSWLFDQAGAERVQAGTAMENAAMRRVFTRLGFPLEGVMRAFMPAGPQREDYALYAVTRDDWRDRRM
jgi:diamine N-acetyltransferase